MQIKIIKLKSRKIKREDFPGLFLLYRQMLVKQCNARSKTLVLCFFMLNIKLKHFGGFTRFLSLLSLVSHLKY